MPDFKHCASQLIEYKRYHLKIYTLTLGQSQEILKDKHFKVYQNLLSHIQNILKLSDEEKVSLVQSQIYT